MGGWSTGRAEFALGCQEVGIALRRELAALRWTIHHEEEARTKDGHRLAIVVGTTSPFGGAGVGSLLMRGAAAVTFLLRIEEIDATHTAVQVGAGGTEGALGIDWGRNKGVVSRLLGAAEQAIARR